MSTKFIGKGVFRMKNVIGGNVAHCMKEVSDTLLTKKKLTAEIRLADGSKKIYRAEAKDYNKALMEIVYYVKSLEIGTEEKVLWRLNGEKLYRMGATVDKPKTQGRFKKFLEYLFALD
ncbi:DUF6018 family natural product bioysynthesis protein [Priestia koreensis]|uniref:DUF6018 family natural product bioysynthesis protein n=1 Tax=Priestia koreensis TaxID=284581 RepID=UPI002412DE67|nr:DUF6018 family natural product bioysynthesis protein [Priestia koreensis]